MKRQRSLPLSFVLVFLIASCLVIGQPVKAQSAETITINADGIVDPSNAPIQQAGNLYVLTDDAVKIFVLRNNIILDGNGHTLQGVIPGSSKPFSDTTNNGGIYLDNVQNVTVTDFSIKYCPVGISLDYSSNVTVSGNNISDSWHPFPFSGNVVAGILIWQSDYNTITGNLLQNNMAGIIIMEYSEHNAIVGNTISGSTNKGVYLYESSTNTLYHNNLDNAENVYDGSSRPAAIRNAWDNGEEGNFWSDYNGTDADGNGVGDTPYKLYYVSQDRYPLMKPFDIAQVLDSAPPVTSVNKIANPSENSWTSKASMPTARGGLGVVAVNGKIYAIGGSTSSGMYPADVFEGSFVATNEEYDPSTDTWATKMPMPTPRDYFAIAAYGNQIYCIGGAVGSEVVDERSQFRSYVMTRANEVYDTITNRWEAKAPMPYDAMKISASVVNGTIYVMYGAYLSAYDIANDSWTAKSKMPANPSISSGSATYPVSVAVGNKIFVTGEFRVGPNYSEEQQVWIYDTETDAWTQGTSGPTVVNVGAAGVTAGKNATVRMYILGLDGGTFPSITANQVYDPKTDAWATAAAMPTLCMDFGAAVVDDVLYAVGGFHLDSPSSGSVTSTNINLQYTPIGYVTPEPTSPTPSVSPSPSTSPAPTPSPTLSPTETPSPSASPTQQPTQSPELSATSISTAEIILATVTVVIAVSIAAVAIRKSHRS